MNNSGIIQTDFERLKLVTRGKVRDIYEIGKSLLIVATDRISAFDVIMPNPIPEKGKILTQMSIFWFKKMEDIIENHLITTELEEYPEECQPYRNILEGRSMLVKKTEPLPVECVVRGYISGSGWNDYCESKTISGLKLPGGLKESAKLPDPIFTPTTKAEKGEHDASIRKEDVKNLIGHDLTEKIIEVSLKIYNKATEIADRGGIIIADTKMEFGVIDGKLILIDELITPDSSRFWLKDEYEEGRSQKSFDKQFVRDFLLSIKWDKKPPAPELPSNIIEKTREKYKEALMRIVR